jgi:large subunit ribosomal protein L2
MATKNYKPTSPGRRFQTGVDFSELTTDKPHKPLTRGKTSSGGRNNRGVTSVRFRGGGHKRRYRVIDFRSDKVGVPAKVEEIEYDPNRSARIARLVYRDGERRYILSPEGLKVGQTVLSGEDADILPGNCLPLRSIPPGTMVHAIELRRKKGAQMVRAAGTAAQLLAKEGDYAQLRLPSGEMRRVHLDCRATIGQVGNLDHENVSFGKAGRRRYLGRRPHNRGVSMNPVDHPMGGGEGKSAGGRHPSSPWGMPTKGYKTRHNRRTDRYIVRRRVSRRKRN